MAVVAKAAFTALTSVATESSTAHWATLGRTLELTVAATVREEQAVVVEQPWQRQMDLLTIAMIAQAVLWQHRQ